MTNNRLAPNRRLITLGALLFLFMQCILPSGAFAQTQRKSRFMMWKVSFGKKTTYLLGSVHLGSKEFYPLPKEVENAFEDSSELVVEVNLNKVDPAKMKAIIQSKGFYAGDDTLWQHLSSPTAEKLRKFSVENGVSPEAFAKLKPWVVAVNVSVIPAMKSGMQAGLGIDQYFLNKARESNKRIAELESAEWQLGLFSQLSSEAQEQYLLATLDQTARSKTFGDDLQQTWLHGDAERMDALISEVFREPVAVQRKLREDRNPSMVEAVEKCLKGQEQCFVVVGAAHLVGKEGIVSLLKSRGIRGQPGFCNLSQMS